MQKDDFKPTNIPQLSPYFAVRNITESMDFYIKAFGFEERAVMKSEDGRPYHVEMALGDAYIMFMQEGFMQEGTNGMTRKSPESSGIEAPFNIYIYVHDSDAIYRQAIKHGAVSIFQPNDAPWGDRHCSLRDPDGYVWSFGTLLPK